MKRKILLVGGSGFIGQCFNQILSTKDYEVVSTFEGRNLKDIDSFPNKEVKLDLEDREDIERVIGSEKPDIIINLAGLVGYGLCEKNPELAYNINTKAVEYLINAAKPYKPLFVQFSTEAVFDGERGLYTEADSRNAKNIYGKTKSDGDKIVEASPFEWIIIRPSLVYGRYKYRKLSDKFIDSVESSVKERGKFEVLSDVFNSPIYVDDLCNATLFLIEKNARGVFNVAGPDILSKYEFALKIAEKLQLDTKKIVKITTDDLPGFATSPKKAGLDISKLKEFGYSPIGIDMGLIRYTSK